MTTRTNHKLPLSVRNRLIEENQGLVHSIIANPKYLPFALALGKREDKFGGSEAFSVGVAELVNRAEKFSQGGVGGCSADLPFKELSHRFHCYAHLAISKAIIRAAQKRERESLAEPEQLHREVSQDLTSPFQAELREMYCWAS